jgi:uncharacterized membrane protein YeaQ/YmgE (transglycosylase-associated protein family)
MEHEYHLDDHHWIYRGCDREIYHARRQRAFGLRPHHILGIIGAFVATYLGQAIGWYRAGEGAGLIGAVVGAVIVLVIWGFIAGGRRRSV